MASVAAEEKAVKETMEIMVLVLVTMLLVTMIGKGCEVTVNGKVYKIQVGEAKK